MRIVLEGVSKRFGARTVVDALSLEIRSGELFGLLGPSGSGKSTVLSMIAGLTTPSSGNIVLGDRVVNNPKVQISPRDRRIGMVFQELALWPHMTVRQHLDLVAPKENHGELLKALEIADRAAAKPSTLSGGEAQRVAIARALAVRPQILLMDEPLGPLDRRLKEHLLDLVEKAHGISRATTVYVTHDYEEAFRLADRVGVIVDGRLVQMGTPEEVYERPASEQVARLTGPVTEWEGKWARPEWIEVRKDESGAGVVREARYRDGRWELEVELGMRRLRAYSDARVLGKVSVTLNRRQA